MCTCMYVHVSIGWPLNCHVLIILLQDLVGSITGCACENPAALLQFIYCLTAVLIKLDSEPFSGTPARGAVQRWKFELRALDSDLKAFSLDLSRFNMSNFGSQQYSTCWKIFRGTWHHPDSAEPLESDVYSQLADSPSPPSPPVLAPNSTSQGLLSPPCKDSTKHAVKKKNLWPIILSVVTLFKNTKHKICCLNPCWVYSFKYCGIYRIVNLVKLRLCPLHHSLSLTFPQS